MSVTETASMPEKTANTTEAARQRTVDVSGLKLSLKGPAGIVDILKGLSRLTRANVSALSGHRDQAKHRF